MNLKALEPIDIRIAILFATVLVFVIALSKYSPQIGGGASYYSGKYDTDPNNDRYIKGDMTPLQIKIFNRVLCAEKKQNGKKVSIQKIRKIAGYKNYETIQAAYKRWRECKDLNRNKDYVIYPPRCP